jgi:prephenate dehydrogenase
LGARRDRFVAGHPIAGGEASGVDAGNADLFDERDVILCADTDADTAPAADALERVSAMWQLLGARVACMTPAHHDRLFAGVSHLPHLLAFAFIEHILQSPAPDERLAFAGAGFRDFTRIAASSPAMWRDICLANRTSILAEFDHYVDTLGQLRALVADGDADALQALFARSRAARADWRQGADRSASCAAAPAEPGAPPPTGAPSATAPDMAATAATSTLSRPTAKK